MAFVSCNPSGRWDEVLVHESEDAFTDLLELFLFVSNLSCRLSFLVSLDNLLDLNLHLMFFDLPGFFNDLQLFAAPSFVSVSHPCFSTRHLSILNFMSPVLCCCSSSDFLTVCTWFFSTRLLSASQLQSSFQSRLGVLLLSRQTSILVLLPCDDDFQYPCFSSSVQLLSSRLGPPRTSQPAVGTALAVLLMFLLFGYALFACCWLCSSRLLLTVLFCLLAMLFSLCSAVRDSRGSLTHPSSSPLCSISAIWLCLFR